MSTDELLAEVARVRDELASEARGFSILRSMEACHKADALHGASDRLDAIIAKAQEARRGAK